MQRAWPFFIGLTLAVAAHADDVTDAENRCTRRLVQSLTGLSVNMAGIGTPVVHPIQQNLSAFYQRAEFLERLAQFINSRLSPAPSNSGFAGEDAVYWLSKYVIEHNLPWREVFVGKYTVTNPDRARPDVLPDPNGLGIFRTPGWLTRYAGNAPDQLRLSTAYRLLQNTTGLKMVPAANNNVGDVTATGRHRAACAGCHFDGPWPLDKVANVLGKKVKVRRPDGQFEWHSGPPVQPEMIFGQLIHDDQELVNALVSSTDFRFWTCRLAFEFVTGRPESSCEGEVFDRCIDAFDAHGTLVAAIAAVAESPEVCAP